MCRQNGLTSANASLNSIGSSFARISAAATPAGDRTRPLAKEQHGPCDEGVPWGDDGVNLVQAVVLYGMFKRRSKFSEPRSRPAALEQHLVKRMLVSCPASFWH
jgi:hypothetical protein